MGVGIEDGFRENKKLASAGSPLPGADLSTGIVERCLLATAFVSNLVLFSGMPLIQENYKHHPPIWKPSLCHVWMGQH